MPNQSLKIEHLGDKGVGADWKCAVCGVHFTGDVAVRLGPSFLSRCNACFSWTYLPRIENTAQAAIHDNAEYFDHPYFQLRRAGGGSQQWRCRDIFARITRAAKEGGFRGERLLDVGCDTGTFLAAAKEEYGIVPMGVDVSERAIREARRRGIEAYHTTLEGAPPHLSGFRLITAIDLIEHLLDPRAFLIEVRRRLRPGGLFYLETPNIRSVVYRFGEILSKATGGRPRALLSRLFPPQHVQYFTPESLRWLAEANGFEVVRLGTRILPVADIATGLVPLLGITLLQACDRLLGREILICAVLARASEAEGH